MFRGWGSLWQHDSLDDVHDHKDKEEGGEVELELFVALPCVLEVEAHVLVEMRQPVELGRAGEPAAWGGRGGYEGGERGGKEKG